MTTWMSMTFQSPSGLMMEIVALMHDYCMMFLLSILILVLVNLSFSFFFFFFSMSFKDNHVLEIVWTLLPFFILIFMLIPSLFSLYMLDTCVFCGLTLSIYGHQWYWSYCYKDLLVNSFDSYMLPSESSNIRLLDVDNRLIIPSYMPIRFLISSSDVIHSWALPSLGLKMDAIPGRINQFCTSFKRSGIFFGQCSEICGANHSFMPIVMESIPFSNFCKMF